MVKLRLNKFRIVVLLSLGMLAVPSYPATPQRVTVKGVVRDLITNEPLSYVTVAANNNGPIPWDSFRSGCPITPQSN